MTETLKSYVDQVQAQAGLKALIEKDRWTALGQALNQAFNGQGKSSGNHTVDGAPEHVLHASAGKVGTDVSVTLFYFFKETTFHLVALGEHVTADLYKIDRTEGQKDAPFQKNKTVNAKGEG